MERFCIGVYGTFGFNETLVGENTRRLPASTTPLSYTGSYTFTIPAGVGSDWNDIYCKIYGGSPGVPLTLFGDENALGINPTMRLLAGPYYTNLFGEHLVDSCIGQADVSLAVASTPAQQSADIDFMLVPKSLGGIDNGTYGLRVWVEGSNALAEQDNVLIVSRNP